MFKKRVFWQTATAVYFLDPASWLSFTAVSITARGERELGDCAADILDTLIPTKTSSRETVTTTKHRTLLFDMGIMGILISGQSTLKDHAKQTNLIRALPANIFTDMNKARTWGRASFTIAIILCGPGLRWREDSGRALTCDHNDILETMQSSCSVATTLDLT